MADYIRTHRSSTDERYAVAPDFLVQFLALLYGCLAVWLFGLPCLFLFLFLCLFGGWVFYARI